MTLAIVFVITLPLMTGINIGAFILLNKYLFKTSKSHLLSREMMFKAFALAVVDTALFTFVLFPTAK